MKTLELLSCACHQVLQVLFTELARSPLQGAHLSSGSATAGVQVGLNQKGFLRKGVDTGLHDLPILKLSLFIHSVHFSLTKGLFDVVEIDLVGK